MILSFENQSSAQQYRYDVVKGGKTIGEMIATKTVIGDTTVYVINSNTVFKLIFSLKIFYELNETYVNGSLLKGDGLSTLNGTIQRKVETRKSGKKYEVENTSNIVSIEKDAIKYSIPELYFSEPKGSTMVFSQIFASYLEFEEISEHTYMLYSEDGKNTYFYKNGVCVEVEVNRPYATFSLILKPK
ncbi:MAG: hypothetical protein JXR07_16980 [Reichenbachiella sp.]